MGREMVKVPKVRDLIGRKVTSVEVSPECVIVYFDDGAIIRTVPILENHEASITARLRTNVGTY